MKKKIIPPLKSPKQMEREYKKELNTLANRIIKEVKEQLIPVLKAYENTYTQDGIADQLGVVFRRLNSIFTGNITIGFAQSTANNVVTRLEKYNKSKFDAAVNRATGVDLSSVISSSGLDDFVKTSINKNVSLIKSLPEEYFKTIETIVLNGVMNGERYSTIAKQISEQTNKKLTSRIKTIARNEVSTINAQINKRRSEALGIKKAIFRTSEDERVRKCHKELDGVEFELSKGAWSKTCQKYIIPGITDINCRCSYSPIIEI